MKHLLLAAAAFVAGGAMADWTPTVSADFSGYAPGEVLSSKGASGGAWVVPAGVTATNVLDETRNGIDIAIDPSQAVYFAAADASSTSDVRRIDFTLLATQLSYGSGGDLDASAAFAPAQLQDGTTGFLGYANGKWFELTAPGVTVVENTWIDGRIELKSVGGVRYASYLVKQGGEYVRLKSASGQDWFATQAERERTEVCYAGVGRFSDMGGALRPADAERAFYWIGGAAGDWNDTNNWSLAKGGAPADVCPGAAGDVAYVAGRVTLTRDGKTGVVRDAVITVGEAGSDMIGGDVLPEITLDLSQPCANKALTAESEPFLGRTATYAFSWQRGSYLKAGFTTLSSTATFTPTADDYEHWFRFSAKDGDATVLADEFYFSKLPVLYLTTDDGTMPTTKTDEDGHVRIQGNDAWKAQYGYDGKDKMTIKVRGNSTASYPKKPYKLKLDKKTDLFGMGENKHWVLLANYNDMSQMRNKLAYDFANEIGGLGMDSTWVQCVGNGTLLGTYQFVEHIRPDANRVPVYDWENAAGKVAEAFVKEHGLNAEQADWLGTHLETNLTWVTTDTVSFVTNGVTITDKPSKLWKKYTDDISGGYLFEFSQEYDEVTKFTTTSGKLALPTMLNKPEYLVSNATMLDYCKDYLQDYWDAVTSAERLSSKGLHYSEYCDVGSMAAYWLVNELFTNNDAKWKSRYAYLDQGKKLVFGPVWDFDWGSNSIVVGDNSEHWACLDSEKYSFMKEWASDFYFCQQIYKRYWEVRDRYAEFFATGGTMDQGAAYIREACAVDDLLWPRSRTFAADIQVLHNFHAKRLAWLDKQFSSVTNLVKSLKCDIQTNPSTWNPDAKSAPSGGAPAVPLEWVRSSVVGKDTSYLSASSERLEATLHANPSVWGKGQPLWKDYVAGTNPDPDGTNAVFTVTEFAVTNGVPYIRWTPDLGTKRNYTILGCDDLANPQWHEKKDGDKFFKVNVTMP